MVPVSLSTNDWDTKSETCLPECLDKIKSIHISCLVTGCNLTKGAVVRTVELPTKTEMNVSLRDNTIAFGGSFNMTVNLPVLRRAGLIFNQFVASILLKKLQGCTSTSARVGKLKVKLDRDLHWARTFKRRGDIQSVRTTIRISPGAQTLTLIGVQTSKCYVTEWFQPLLTQDDMLFKSCNKDCAELAASGVYYLDCLMDVCPGHCVTNVTSLLFHLHDSSKICSGSPKAGNSGDGTKSIRSPANSVVTFHLDAIRLRGYQFSVFRTNFLVEQDGEQCSGPVSLRVLLDTKESQLRTVNSVASSVRTNRSEEGNREIVVVVSRADTLSLQATMPKYSSCNLSVKWLNARLVQSLPPHQLRNCSGKCADVPAWGDIYLSCFVGVCDGMTARTNNLPFFRLNYHHDSVRGPGLGIGVNRAGSWAEGKGPIQLTDRHGTDRKFLFGIGAYPGSSITFYLDAFRAHGYNCNFFVTTVGIDSNSGCKLGQLGSVIFRLYVDNAIVPTISTEIHDMSTAGTILYDVSNAGRLTLVTRTGFDDACYNAVWASARLMFGRFLETYPSQ